MAHLLVAALLTLVVASGCGGRAAASGFTGGRLNVVAAFYPLQFLSERIGGDAVTVTNLTKPGAEPHDVELNPRQVARIVDAGVAVHLSGFQPAVDTAVEQEAAGRSFDAGAEVELLAMDEHEEEHAEPGHDHAETAGGLDPHVWLDPVKFATIAERLAERFGQADPARAADYTARAAALHAELDRLDRDFASGLATCARHELVTSHAAFHYLAARYGLHQVGISGITPEDEPSPQRLAHVATEARETGATTIFFETLVSPKVAETIAREIGAGTAVLDPLEGLTDPNADYFTVMRANLAALTTGLGCS
jgi:zinc transport system substrate-binding protein